MSITSFTQILKANGTLHGGGRRESQWFALPNKLGAQRRRFGCGPAVISGCMKDCEAGPRELGLGKSVGVGSICLF